MSMAREPHPRRYIVRSQVTGISILTTLICIIFLGFLGFWVFRIAYYDRVYYPSHPIQYTAWYMWVWVVLFVFMICIIGALTERVVTYRRIPQYEQDVEPIFDDEEEYEEPRGTYVDFRNTRQNNYGYSPVHTDEKPEPRRAEENTQPVV
jgi:magnesium-transporting ATPase (P-type)